MNALTFLCFGIASWFVPSGIYSGGAWCAMNVAPPGTRILIVNEDNRREATCTILGSGPFVSGRVLDVAPSVAKRLGFYSSGLAHVRIYRILRVRAHRTNVKVWSHP
jgi:hypothetical protein